MQRVKWHHGLSPEDKKTRSNGIGSSEIAMLIVDPETGKPFSPWGGAHKLWRSKTEPPKDFDSAIMKRGRYLESGLIEWYADDNGYRVKKPRTVRHSEYEYVVDSVDGLVWTDDKAKEPDRCLEVKTTHYTQRFLWGPPGSDQVPRYYNIQGQWHCGAWKMPVCDHVVHWGEELPVYTVPFEEELYLALVYEAEKFWNDFVVPKKAPPVDGAYETSQWLSDRMQNMSKDMVYADDDSVSLLLAYGMMRVKHNESEATIDLMENQLKERIGENDGLIIPNTKATVTFKEVAGRSFTDHKALLDEVITQRDLLARAVATIDTGSDDVAKAKELTLRTLEELNISYKGKGKPYRRFWPAQLVKHVKAEIKKAGEAEGEES